MRCLDGAVSALQTRAWNGRFHAVTHYRYAAALPLWAGDDALRVNWCEVTFINFGHGDRYLANVVTFFVTILTLERQIEYTLNSEIDTYSHSGDNYNPKMMIKSLLVLSRVS